MFSELQEPIKPVGNLSADTFHNYAGEDNEIDARDLRDLLSELSRKEFSETMSVGIEGCRALISMIDVSLVKIVKNISQIFHRSKPDQGKKSVYRSKQT